MTRISVNPAHRRLRSAFARIISDYAESRGLRAADPSRTKSETSTSRGSIRGKSEPKERARPRPDLVWLDRGRAAWKFYILPGAQARRRLRLDSRIPADVIVCADRADNLGFIEPAALLDFLQSENTATDIDTVRSLAGDIARAPMFSPDFHFTGMVQKNHHFLKDHFSLCIRTGPTARPAPGQFLQILCDPAPHAESAGYRIHSVGGGRRPKLRGIELLARRPFLRRPFSIASYGPKLRRDDMKDVRRLGAKWFRLINWVESEFEIIYRRVPGGPGTGALAGFRAGDKIDVVGPLGKGFAISPPPEVALLVGGGIGATPMLFLAEELSRAGIDVKMFVGAVTRARIPFGLRGGPKHRIPRLERSGISPVICTDDGSAGRRALVTEPLARYLGRRKKKSLSAKIFACGPRPMLAALEGIAMRHDTPCEVLLEERMACGFGACISCVCGVKETGRRARYTRVCTEGPAFDVKKVMWHA